MMIRSFKLPPRVLFALAALALVAPALTSGAARAQALVATVNDDPVTSYDIDQRIKLLKALKRPSTPDAALEAIVADRLRLREMRKYNLTPGVAERNAGLAKIAGDMKTPPQALVAAFQGAGLSEKDWSEYFNAEAGWILLTRGLHKGLEVSEREVRAELDRRGGRAAAASEYLLRQVVLIVPIGAAEGVLQKRLRDAELLRQRFADCVSGLALVRDTPEAVVKEQFSRMGHSLPDEVRAILDKTPVGHLTPPSRGATGVEMIALCARRDSRDDDAAGEEIRNELLARKLDALAARSYADLRKRAVVVKR